MGVRWVDHLIWLQHCHMDNWLWYGIWTVLGFSTDRLAEQENNAQLTSEIHRMNRILNKMHQN